MLTWQAFDKIAVVNLMMLCWPDYQARSTTSVEKYAPCLLGLVWLISRIFSANEQYFSLTSNQPTVLSAMAYQPNEQDTGG